MAGKSKSFVYDIWRYSYKLPGTQLSIRGHSRGSEKSCFYIPELKVFLDAGCESYFNPDFIFITHCHSDHSFQLPMILTGLDRTRKNDPKIYAPSESRELFQNFLQTTYQLRKGTDRVYGHFRVSGVNPGMDIDLNKEGYFVRVYNMCHNVPTRGYGICQLRKKLNPVYLGLDGKELKKLRDTGVDINMYHREKIFAYVLDTNINCFSFSPELLEYKYVMVECTFLMDENKSVTDYHIHWSELRNVIKENPNVYFMLVHFSMRYSWDEIDVYFSKEKEEIPNMMIWMN
jgi:ribonuclease Z